MRLSLRLVWGLPKLVALPTPPSSVNKGRPSYIPLFVPPPTLSWHPSAARAGIMLYEIFAGKMLALRSDFRAAARARGRGRGRGHVGVVCQGAFALDSSSGRSRLPGRTAPAACQLRLPHRISARSLLPLQHRFRQPLPLIDQRAVPHHPPATKGPVAVAWHADCPTG